MSVIKRSDLIDDAALNWPKQYAAELDKIIAKSKQLGQKAGGGSAQRNKLTELEKVQKQLSVSTEKSTEEFIKQKAALNTLNATTREAVKDVQSQGSAYDKLDRKLIKLSKQYQDLVAAEKQNTAEGRKLLKVTSKLDAKLKAIDNTVGKNQRSVGKYSLATKGLNSTFSKLSAKADAAALSLKNLSASGNASSKQIKKASAKYQNLNDRVVTAKNSMKQFDVSTRKAGHGMHMAGGFLKEMAMSLRMMVTMMGPMMAVFAIIAAIGDAFRRIKEFDKSIVELSAVLGVGRKELAGLEEKIRQVASASTKTSTEVAELAITLATLGKSEAEIRNLIEPTNNLSIALKATSEEAGQLLVSTLNAFGESSESAERFADVIAKMRTSSALDFERIKDSLSFLSPTARAAGVSFERTGAILGVLVDNSVKAARAGRLMSTTFLRLAARGMTLEDALDQINKKQKETTNELELLKLAGDLFGKRAAALGLILADNRGEVDKLTESYKNSQGTLKELTDVQLTSLSAKMNILDSVYERVILKFSKPVKFIFGSLVLALTEDLRFLSGQVEDTTSAFEKQRQAVKAQHVEMKSLVDAIKDTNENEELRKNLIDKLNEKYPEFLKNVKDEDVSNALLSDKLREVTNEMENRYLVSLKQIKLAPLLKQLNDLKKSELEATLAVEKANAENASGLSLQEKVMNDINKAYETNDSKLRESAQNLQTQLFVLAASAEEYDRLNTEIDAVTKTYDDMMNASGKATTALLTDVEKMKNALELVKVVLAEREIDLQSPLAKANVELQKMKVLAEDGTLPYLDRISALERTISLETQIIAWEKELRDLNIEKLKLEFEIEGSLKNELRLEKAKADAITKTFNEQKKLTSLTKRANKEIQFLDRMILANKKDIISKGIESTKSGFEQEIEAKKAQNERLLAMEKKLTEDVAKINEDAKEENNKKELEGNDQRDEFLRQSADDATDIANRFTDLKLEQIDQELRALEFAKNRELQAAGDNELKKAQIEKKFEGQRKKLQKKAAQAEKLNALFRIAINTAVAIAKAGAAIPLAILAAAVGVAQAAIVLATPLPKFDKGKDRTPKDYIAGEKRPELRKSKGKWSVVDKPTMFKNSPGDTIVSGKQTDSILGTIQDITGNNILTDKGSILSLLNNDFAHKKPQKENLSYILKKNNEDLIKTIRNKKEVNINVNTSNTKVYEKSGNTIVNRIDYYYSR